MEVIYKTLDGQQFSSSKEAQKHEDSLDAVKEQKLRDNLAIYLANKSRLKASILPQEVKRLRKDYAILKKNFPSKFSELVKKIDNDAFMSAYYDVKQDMRRLRILLGQLYKARKMIPRINAALKAGKDFWCYELFDTPTEIG